MDRLLMLRLHAMVALLASGPLTSAGWCQNVGAPRFIQGFSVHRTDGKTETYRTQGGKVTVVVFVSTRCPISNAFNFRLNSLYTQFSDRVQFAAVDSNVDESAEEVAAHAKAMEYDFPVFQDVNNSLADLLGAKATPDSFVIDTRGLVVYHGYIEDAPNAQRSKDPALRVAIEATLQGRDVPVRETHARGCAIRRARGLR